MREVSVESGALRAARAAPGRPADQVSSTRQRPNAEGARRAAALVAIAAAAAICYAEAGGRARLIAWDRDSLDLTRSKWRANEPDIAAAKSSCLYQATLALSHGPYSVVYKEVLPPSLDLHDFLSYGSYWWPDPNSPTGLPWIPKDGMINPANAIDLDQLYPLISDLNYLGLAYYFTDDEVFAQHAAHLLRVFFIDADTRMNPRCLYAELIPGVSTGACDVVSFGYASRSVLDAAAILERSPHWTSADRSALVMWMAQFLLFCETHPKGLVQFNEPSNHGSNFDWATAAMSLYIGNPDRCRSHLLHYLNQRMNGQIAPDGSNPLEMLRADNFLYHRYNLEIIMWMGALADRAPDLDLWSYQLPDGRGPRLACDFITPYLSGELEWPFWPGTPFQISWIHNYIALRMAAVGWSDPALLDAAVQAYPAGPSANLYVNLTHPAEMVFASRLKGDMNGDGAVDFGDIDPFVAALQGPDAYYDAYRAARRLNGDFDGDEDVGFSDIDGFVASLAGPPPATATR